VCGILQFVFVFVFVFVFLFVLVCFILLLEMEEEGATVKVFGKMTWCLIPEDAVVVTFAVSTVVFFTFEGFGRLLAAVILMCFLL